MGTNSAIEWTTHTFNPWEGCTKVSAGCKNCYAKNRNARFGGGTAPNWGPGAPRRRTSLANWLAPLRWNRLASPVSNTDGLTPCDPYSRPRVFCASLADWLDDEVPFEWLADLLDMIRRTPNLNWLLLTKRPQNWRPRLSKWRNSQLDMMSCPKLPRDLYDWVNNWLQGTTPSNVWVGTSVENQEMADERIPILLSIPAVVRFLSCEPLLGFVDLTLPSTVMPGGYNSLKPYRPVGCTIPEQPRIHWVICGGESGPDARPMHPDWARSLRDQCAAAGVPFFYKQTGEWGSGFDLVEDTRGVKGLKYFPDLDRTFARVGKKAAGRLLDGVTHDAFPQPFTP
jgi:protein gp37